ncbi:hypothetical protein ACFQY0_09910 [Haloferula chungangensis]|uniref:Uncharacterized protein n=1 Tax=Haloferula chungangensis TaxID=1048331 RepID=A0ABW2L7G2_9BACT
MKSEVTRSGLKLCSRVALPFLILASAQADELAIWDFVTASDSAAVLASASGLSVSAVTMGPGISNTNDSTSGGWRTRGYEGTTGYVEFSITAASTKKLTLESLIFGAFARAANTGGGGEWTDPEIILEYDTDPGFTNPTVAGSLDLGPSLLDGSDEPGSSFTSDASTFFGSDLVINPSETYYFRLRASDATGGTSSRNQLYYLVDTDLVLNGSIETSTPGLVWAGASGASWNTTELNFTDDGTPSLFTTNDDVTIKTLGDIVVDAGGITAGLLSVITDEEGNFELQGGNLSTTGIVKSGVSDLEIALAGTFDTGAGGTTVEGGNLEVESGATFTTSSLTLSSGAEFRVENGGIFTNSGLTSLIGSEGGILRANSGTSISLGEVSTMSAGAKFDKSGSGTLTITGPLGTFDSAPIFLDFNGGTLVFEGANVVAVAGRSGELNTWQSGFLNGTDLVLHNANIDGGSITIQGTGTTIRSRLNDGANTIASEMVLESDLIINSPSGDNAITFTEPFSGPGGITLGGDGNGDVYFDESSSYTGTTTLLPSDSFTLHATTDGKPFGDGDISIGTGSILNLDNHNMSIPGDISGDGAILVDSSFSISGGKLLPVEFSGDSSFTGSINLLDGLTQIDGTNSFSGTTRGVLTIEDSGALGGNGSSEHEVVMEAGGALSAVIQQWDGVAGEGYEDLYVHSFDAAGVAMDIRMFWPYPAPPDFSESARSFTFLTTSAGGLTNFDPANVTIIPRSGFIGTGTWSVEQVEDSLVLNYTPLHSPYELWTAGFDLEGEDAAPDYDYDLDGMANILEFVLGGDPTVSDPSVLPVSMFDGTDFVFSYTRSEESKGSTTQRVQFGTNLVDWTDALIPEAEGSYTIEGVTVDVVEGDPASLPDTITVTIPNSLAPALGSRFARLSVEEN